jgi:hypothetical protein
MRKFSLSALVAAGLLVGGLSVGSASAADLGGNCCADLEERIAELEATTARKGNRKVSLTISGWVGEQVLWWDDGAARGTYVGGLGTTLASHVTFSGQATIMPGWYAGYVLTLEADEHDPLFNSQGNWSSSQGNLNLLPASGFTTPSIANTSVFGSVDVLNSYWFIKSDHLGKVSVGQQSSAGDNAAILVDGSGSLVPANWVMFDNASFAIRSKTGNLTGVTWGDLGNCFLSGNRIGGDCEAIPTNVVRYDSPVFAGFSVSADWGQNGGYWDAYARYAGEYNGIKIAATSGWSQDNTGNLIQSSPLVSLPSVSPQFHGECNTFFTGAADPLETSHFCDVGYWQSGLYIEHVATGVFVYGAYGREFLSDVNPGFNDEPEHWYAKAGLRERWSSIGHSVAYGFYSQRNDMMNSALVSGAGGVFQNNAVCAAGTGNSCTATGSRTTEWGGGFVQEIDAAAMSLWVQAERFDANVGGCALGVDSNGACTASSGIKSSLDAMTVVKFGGLINF